MLSVNFINTCGNKPFFEEIEIAKLRCIPKFPRIALKSLKLGSGTARGATTDKVKVPDAAEIKKWDLRKAVKDLCSSEGASNFEQAKKAWVANNRSECFWANSPLGKLVHPKGCRFGSGCRFVASHDDS